MVPSPLVVALLSAALVSAQKTFIIAGGGTAGLAVAARLSENSQNKVIVLEAGEAGFDNPNIIDFTKISTLPGSSVDWNYRSEPATFAVGQTFNMTRGKVLGGSSAVNGAIYTIGTKTEYNIWESALGASGWNWNSISAAAKKSEKFNPSTGTGLTSVLSFHGSSGPVNVGQTLPNPIWTTNYLPAVQAAGGKISIDQRGGDPSGVWLTPRAMFPNVTRSYSANSYYRPVASRSNLDVRTSVTVSRIIWEGSRNGNVVATGIEYITSTGTKVNVTADVVVLSGGVFGSPQILELSGVGNPSVFNKFGIKTVVNLPSVGENLSEQPCVRFTHTLTNLSNIGVQLPMNFESASTLFTKEDYAKALQLLRKEIPSGLSKTRYNAIVELFLKDVPVIEYMGFPGANAFIVLPIVLHPLSRGNSHIKSADPKAAPKFDLALGKSAYDLFVMTAALKRARRFAQQLTLAPILKVGGEVIPGAAADTDAKLVQSIKENLGVGFHPLGTAVLGPKNDGGVVDSNLKVYGTDNVHVIDGAVLPLQISGHPHATIYAVAERGVEILKQVYQC